jgi:TfoX/Sxy family transcriptional regulator of competence genes
MGYNEAVAQRVRNALMQYPNITEKKMFGGLAFLLGGNMCCGITGDDLMVRVGPPGYKEALSRPHARKMDLTGKPLTGFVYVGPAGFASDSDLKAWVAKAAEFALSLPAKTARMRNG